MLRGLLKKDRDFLRILDSAAAAEILGGRCGGCLPPLRGPLVGRHLGRGYLGLPGLIVTNTSVVPQQQRHQGGPAACVLAG